MKSLIKQVILLLSLLNIVTSTDILECNYYFSSYNSDSSMILTIEGHKYRETICKPNLDNGCYFATSVKRRDLNVSYIIDGFANNIPYLSCKYHKGFIIDSKLEKKDKLIKNNQITLLKSEYYYPKNHILNVVTLITLKPFDIKQPNIYLDIYFNNILKSEDVLSSEMPFVSHKLKFDGYEGYNNIELLLESNGLWCSCPSMDDGFSNNRYILAWISDIEENNKVYINDNKYIEISIGNPNIISI